MERSDAGNRLSGLDTYWTVLGRGRGESAEAVAAKQQLLERYTAAVHRYLLGALRDAEAADELTQEFAVRFMKGDLHRADPTRGRFRDFVKGVLFHLIADHYRRLKRMPPGLPDGSLPDANAVDPAADDQQFTADWRGSCSAARGSRWKGTNRNPVSSTTPYYSTGRTGRMSARRRWRSS